MDKDIQTKKTRQKKRNLVKANGNNRVEMELKQRKSGCRRKLTD